MADLRPPLDAFDAAFGEAATVTPPGRPPVQATVIELPKSAVFPSGGDAQLSVVEALKIFGVRRDQVPTLPRGSRIQVGAEIYTVDTVVEDDGEVLKVAVR